MARARLILTALWWAWGLALFALLIALSSNLPLFGSQTRAVWEWFLPNILPTMTLVGAAAYVGKPDRSRTRAMTQPLILCVVASVAHLTALSVAILGTLSSEAPVEHLRSASLWLGPLQALATSSLGVFFVKGK